MGGGGGGTKLLWRVGYEGLKKYTVVPFSVDTAKCFNINFIALLLYLRTLIKTIMQRLAQVSKDILGTSLVTEDILGTSLVTEDILGTSLVTEDILGTSCSISSCFRGHFANMYILVLSQVSGN